MPRKIATLDCGFVELIGKCSRVHRRGLSPSSLPIASCRFHQLKVLRSVMNDVMPAALVNFTVQVRVAF
jgi:hypothetical protein